MKDTIDNAVRHVRTSDKAVNQRLDASQLTNGFLMSALDAFADSIHVVEADGTIAFLNQSARIALGADVGAVWQDIWPASVRPALAGAFCATTDGKVTEFEAYCPAPTGGERWWHVTVAPLKDRADCRVIATSRDITERVLRERAMAEREQQVNAHAAELAEKIRCMSEQLDQQKAIMLEADHRMRNCFAMLSALLRLQSRKSTEITAKSAIEDAARRINTIARVHGAMHHFDKAAALRAADFLPSLLTETAQSVDGGTDVSVRIGYRKPMRPAHATAIAMIAAELTAYVVRRESRDVRISLLERDDRFVELTIEHDAPHPPPSSDLALTVCKSFAQQVDGDIDVADRTYVLRFAPN